MKYLLFLLLPFNAYCISNGEIINSNNELSKYVVSVKSYFSSGTKNCTGTIIGNFDILTASHCVYLNKEHAKRVEVYFNTKSNTGTYIRVASVVIPKQRFQDIDRMKNGDTRDLTLADLADLKLPTSIPDSYSILPIADKVDMNSKVYSLGYGGTYDKENVGNLNLGITNIQNTYTDDVIDIRSNDKINNMYTHICPQDSGGPDIQYINGVPQLIGIHYGYMSENMTPTCTVTETSKINTMKFLSTDVTYFKNRGWLNYELTGRS